MRFQRFKTSAILTKEEAATVVAAIRSAETVTCGEIRVYLETKNKYVNPIDRAKGVFAELNMQKTVKRNGVLIYVASKDKEICILGDEGIYKVLEPNIWKNIVTQLSKDFAANEYVKGFCTAIESIGLLLHTHFPYDKAIDKNELPDDIVFGK